MAGKKGMRWRVRRLPEAQPRSCPVCGTTFVPIRKLANQKYCSVTCCTSIVSKQNILKAHTPEVIARMAAAKRGGSKGYVKFHGRHEHRVVMEKMIGRPLRRGEIVHHKDGNKKNNDPSNLELLTQSEHCKAHDFGHHPGANRSGRQKRQQVSTNS